MFGTFIFYSIIFIKISFLGQFLFREGKLWSYHVLRVVMDWELRWTTLFTMGFGNYKNCFGIVKSRAFRSFFLLFSPQWSCKVCVNVGNQVLFWCDLTTKTEKNYLLDVQNALDSKIVFIIAKFHREEDRSSSHYECLPTIPNPKPLLKLI